MGVRADGRSQDEPPRERLEREASPEHRRARFDRRSSRRECVFDVVFRRLFLSQLQYRINHQIRIPEVRVIDAEGKQLGIIPIDQARRLADEGGLDLVEVAPDARPPVCKIMDYGKFRYTLKKKEHDAKKKSHATQLKEIRLRPKIDKHDRDFKINQAKRFLAEGHKVQLTMLFRGREMAHQEVGRAVMDNVLAELGAVSKVERSPSMEGRRMTAVLTHK